MTVTHRATAIAALLAALLWAVEGHAQRRKRRPSRRTPATEAAKPQERAPAEATPTGRTKGEVKDTGADRPEVQVEGTGRKKVYRIKTEFVIEGRIQKPNAFYVLQRSNINYEWVDLKQEFAPRILQSVREHPF